MHSVASVARRILPCPCLAVRLKFEARPNGTGYYRYSSAEGARSPEMPEAQKPTFGPFLARQARKAGGGRRSGALTDPPGSGQILPDPCPHSPRASIQQPARPAWRRLAPPHRTPPPPQDKEYRVKTVKGIVTSPRQVTLAGHARSAANPPPPNRTPATQRSDWGQTGRWVGGRLEVGLGGSPGAGPNPGGAAAKGDAGPLREAAPPADGAADPGVHPELRPQAAATAGWPRGEAFFFSLPPLHHHQSTPRGGGGSGAGHGRGSGLSMGIRRARCAQKHPHQHCPQSSLGSPQSFPGFCLRLWGVLPPTPPGKGPPKNRLSQGILCG